MYKSTQGQVENKEGNMVDERYYCAFSYYIVGTSTKRVQFFSAATDGAINAKNANVDYAWSDMRWYWCHFESVDPATNVTLKTIMGFEFQPTPGSLLMTQVRPAAVPDELCMNSVAEVSNIGFDAFMAKFNGSKDGIKIGEQKHENASGNEKLVIDDLISEAHTHNAAAKQVANSANSKPKPQRRDRRVTNTPTDNGATQPKSDGPNQRRSGHGNKVSTVPPVNRKYKPYVKAAKADLRKATKELSNIKIGKKNLRNKVHGKKKELM
jgi:hypothetical protein